MAMLKLMELEMKKFKIGLKSAVIANIIILGIILMANFSQNYHDKLSFRNLDYGFSTIAVLVKGVFLVFEAVMIGEIVIGEFKSKTISVLFTYPVDRKKIIWAKLLITIIFTFITIVLSNICIDCGYFIINSIYHFSSDNLTSKLIFTRLINIFIDAASFSGIGLITLYFGMLKKSISQTIVSGLILAIFIAGNLNNFMLSAITAIPVSLGIIGYVVAYVCIKSIENADA